MKIVSKKTGAVQDSGLDDFNAHRLIDEYQNDDFIIVPQDFIKDDGKIKYSEEEVRLMLKELSTHLYEIYPLESLEEWFEQFKKEIT